MATPRLGIIGLGTFGINHLRCFRQLGYTGTAQLVAGCEINESLLEERQEEFDFAPYTDFREMLDKEQLDGVTVVTPDHLHHDIVLAAAQAGVNVLCEKPLDVTAKGCVEMIEACQKAVGRITGKVTRYLRPPGGNYSQAVLGYLAGSPYTMVLWTHSAGDWGNPPVSGIVQRCLKNVRPGSIILMHGGDINSVRALPHIIRGLRYRNLEPVTLPEMLGPGHTYQMTIAQALALPQNGWQPEAVK